MEETVQQRRHQVELVEAGGSISDIDPIRRSELVDEAHREHQLAAAAVRTTSARLDALRQQRQRAVVELQQRRISVKGDVDFLRSEFAGAEAELAKSVAEHRLKEFEQERQKRLGDKGAAVEHEIVAARLELDSATGDVLGHEAALAAARARMKTAKDIDAIEPSRMEASLRELDALIATAETETKALERRGELWRAAAESRQRFVPQDGQKRALLRRTEIDLFRSQQVEAEARLADLDRRVGNLVIRAESDGLVDQVHVRAGDVLEPESPIVTYYNPARQWIDAYAPPHLAAKLQRNHRCSIVLLDTHESLEGQVDSVGRAWVKRPEMLPYRGEQTNKFQRCVRIGGTGTTGDWTRRLQPNMRVKVVFSRSLFNPLHTLHSASESYAKVDQ
jgi:hypothetical protein